RLESSAVRARPGEDLPGGDAIAVRTSNPGSPGIEGTQFRPRVREAARSLQGPGPVRKSPSLQDRGAGADRGDDGRRGAGRLRRAADGRIVAVGGAGAFFGGRALEPLPRFRLGRLTCRAGRAASG